MLGRRLRAALAGDDGSVTVEAALGIASIVTVLGLVATGVGASLVQVRLVDAAREAARVAAQSGMSAGVEAGRASGPTGADVHMAQGSCGGAECVTATAAAEPGGLPGLHLEAHAVARVEPGAPS